MRDDEFEWSDTKAASNIEDHKVSFEIARRVFDDPLVLIREDVTEDYGEERLIAIGKVGLRLITVIHTHREDRVRIISAWKASNHEQLA